MAPKEGSVSRAYLALRQMAIDFEFLPGERINETALTKILDVSRTPLREALNRLVAEGFLTFERGRGFFCRPLSPDQVLDLYQLRSALESEALVRAIETASDKDIRKVVAYLDDVEDSYDTCQDLDQLLHMDEEFHMKLAALAGNRELVKLLDNVNERIRYVRIINLRLLRDRKGGPKNNEALSAHRKILNALKKRDERKAVKALRTHIERRSEQTAELVREAFSQLYVPEG